MRSEAKIKISTDLGYKSTIHYGEELCGDKVEMVDTGDSKILILADGMGSGIRANILATLTSKIIATMMGQKLSIEEVVKTISKTLPISSVNGVAYSTFSIVQIFRNGEVYIAEYDNPECILIRDGKVSPLPFVYREIEGKNIRECRLLSKPMDAFVLTSDGCLYCSPNGTMNMSWDWKALAKCAEESFRKTRTASQMADRINRTCFALYNDVAGDDITAGVVRIVEDRAVNIMTGPPVDSADDNKMVTEFMREPGIKIVSGGVTSKIVSRELGKRMEQVIGKLDPEIPPTAKIEGIDLVTEGVLTLSRAIELLEMYVKDSVSEEFFEALSVENGATRLACYLMEDCTTVNLYIGKSINMDYTDKALPFEASIRQNLMKRLIKVLEDMHCEVNVKYY